MNTKALIDSYAETRAREARGSAGETWTEHRPATSYEHGIEGRIHGFCRRCMTPWPCQWAPESKQDTHYATLLTALKKIADTPPRTDTQSLEPWMRRVARKAIAEVGL